MFNLQMRGENLTHTTNKRQDSVPERFKVPGHKEGRLKGKEKKGDGR